MENAMITPEEIGKRISARRQELNLTLQDVADRVQVQNSTIYRYEAGKITKPKLPVIKSIASALGVSSGFLLDKPDLRLSVTQQQEIFRILDASCAKKNITHGFAVSRANISRNFFPRLKSNNLHNAYMYDILAVANYLEVSSEIYDVLTDPAGPSSDNIQPLPLLKEWAVLGGTACGDPLYKELDSEKVLAPANIDADFVFLCVGDSMINARIFDGDIVFVKSGNVEDGQIAVVRIGEEYTLKRIFRGPDYLELRSENPMYPTRIIRGEQENAEIVGRAVHFLSRVI